MSSWDTAFELCRGSGALEACPDLGAVLWNRLPITVAGSHESGDRAAEIGRGGTCGSRIISRDRAEELAVAAIRSAHRNVGADGAYLSSRRAASSIELPQF